MNHELAKQLQDNVHRFYEEQGAWFATTRGKLMPEQTFVSEHIRPGMTVADVGAGNGRFAKLLPKNIHYIGIEPSETLRRSTSLLEPPSLSLIPGSLPHLPLPDQRVDVTVCLAVLHHIPSDIERQKAVQELVRITKPRGTILATSWLRNPHELETQPIKDGEKGDVWMPWTSPEGKISPRFVHFMQDKEWEHLWNHADLEIIQIGMHGKQNWTDNPSLALNWRVIARRKVDEQN